MLSMKMPVGLKWEWAVADCLKDVGRDVLEGKFEDYRHNWRHSNSFLRKIFNFSTLIPPFDEIFRDFS